MKTIQPLSSASNDDSSDVSKKVDALLQEQPHAYATGGHQAAADIVRQQIDRVYDTDPPNQLKNTAADTPQPDTPVGTTRAQAGDPYQRTHDPNSLQNSGQSEAWKHYHSAWQEYYQQYYQRYYMQQLLQQKQHTGSNTPGKKPEPGVSEETVPKRATEQIHDEILEKVKKQAANLRRSSHFMPIVTAVVIGFLFIFMQYNRLFVAQVTAYVSPGSSTSQSIILDPVTDTKVDPEPRIIIPKINVDAPVVYGVGSLRENDIQNALRNGVVHYPYPGANSTPGQVGNTVLLGHTSNDVFDPGNFKFVFVLMERLQEGDTMYVNYEGTRYTYLVTKREVVNPNEINKLVVDTDKPLLTLVGCVPIGTADQRLLVTGEQISPDPSQAASVPQADNESAPQAESLPGEGQTLLERILN